MSLAALVGALRAEAGRTNERRLLVCHGEREPCYERAREAFAASEIGRRKTVLVGGRDVLPVERVAPKRTGKLLGTTTETVVFDGHDACRPNALGRAVGTVDGGELLVLLTPPLDEWPDRRDEFDASLAVSSYDAGDVSGAFRRRFVRLLRAHPGIAIVDAETGAIERSGLTHPAPRLSSQGETDLETTEPASDREREPFPKAVYERCLTDDQARCVRTFERLQDGRSLSGPKVAIVAEADRGRGKSSAAGLAAGVLAARGREVVVTAPSYRASAELFARAEETLTDLDCPIATDDESNPRVIDVREPDTSRGETEGGSIRFVSPTTAADRLAPDPGSSSDPGSTGGNDPDVVFVDEAAGLPVSVLDRLLAADHIAFTTTVHGYEGAGRGFAIRFRERLEASDHDVVEIRLDDPIRYAAGDPIEVWLFRALLLDARPPVDSLVADATPETVRYERLSTSDLAGDEHLLRAVFGLLIAAHYRTEPNDLARLLDAPNLSVRALVHDDHVVTVCLLAREGGLAPERRQAIYEGARIKGHMLPDVLTSQLRDERAGVPRGLRVVRIATHGAVRSRGLGSYLLDRVHEELDRERCEPGTRTEDTRETDGSDGDDPERAATDDHDCERLAFTDWLGVGYGATPQLIDFWRDNGFHTVHVSTTRNERSGEHSVLMLRPLTDRGRALTERHTRWFARRFPAVLSDALSELDADVAREALRAAGASVDPDLSARDWRVICGAAYGSSLYDTDPAPFRQLALAYFTDPELVGSTVGASGRPDRVLSARAERLLVCRVFQARSPEEITRRLDYESKRQCLRALGDAYAALVDRYGGEVARAERERYDG